MITHYQVRTVLTCKERVQVQLLQLLRVAELEPETRQLQLQGQESLASSASRLYQVVQMRVQVLPGGFHQAVSPSLELRIRGARRDLLEVELPEEALFPWKKAEVPLEPPVVVREAS